MKRFFFTFLFSTVCFVAVSGQEGYLPYQPESTPTYISPKYFGPNAFPVPDILKNTTDRLEMEFCSSGAIGHLTEDTDRTLSTDFLLRIPLWTERVNVSVWGQPYECYYTPESTGQVRRIDPKYSPDGSRNGELYISLDVTVLTEGRIRPGIILRGALKTALGGQYYKARGYDSPGYFFDASFSKKISFGHNRGITAALSTGFLCWQLDNGRQNDAVMYGISLGYFSEIFSLSADYGGYIGWKNEGDDPMTIKIRADICPFRGVSPFIAYQHGFVSWPFDQLRIGAKFSVQILRK